MAEQAGESMSETGTETETEADVDVAPRTFSTADVERIVKERLARAKTTPPADYADLQEKAQKLANLEAANQSELEKAVAAREAAERQRDETLAEAREIRLRASIISEAAKPDRKVVDPDSVVALLDRSSLELDDNGVPTNVAEAMDSLLKAKPFLVAAGGARGDADQGARTNGAKQITEAELRSMTPEQIVAARKAGRFADIGVG